MKEIKEFVKDHKKAVIGTIIGVGGVVLGTAAYRIGFNRGGLNGTLKGTIAWAAMIYADLDGTAMLVEDCLSDVDENELREFIRYGNEMLMQNKQKLKELA